VFITAVWNTIFYTVAATVGKSPWGYGWPCAEPNVPFNVVCSAPSILLPWITPTVAVSHRILVVYDPAIQHYFICFKDVLHWTDHNFDFLGTPWHARWSLIAANIWRGIPFVAISLLADCRPSRHRCTRRQLLDGRQRLAALPPGDVAAADAHSGVVLTFSILFTFADFQLV